MLKTFKYAIPIGLSLLAFAFGWHAIDRAVGALRMDQDAMGRLFHPDDLTGNLGIFLHMATGGILTVVAPLQTLPVVRRRWPRVHRISGRVLIGAAIVTAAGGLTYIAIQGTIGGWWMSLWFSLYGVLMLVATWKTLSLARSYDFERHRRWALRLTVLALGSFFYRVHYGLWFAFMGRVGVARDFSGPFDLIQVWAFYLPYLAVLEIWLRWQKVTRQKGFA